MTFKEAQATCRAFGHTLTRRPDGEYRLNVRGGTEATAYYTTDLDDACGTARMEAQHARRFPLTGWQMVEA